MIKGGGVEYRKYEDYGGEPVVIGDYRMLCIPNVNIDQLLCERPFLTKQKKLRREVVREWIALFLAYIYRRTIRYGRVNIPAKELKHIWDNYAEVTRWLAHVGVVFIRNHSEGRFTKQYSVTKEGTLLVPVFNGLIIQKVDEFLSQDRPDNRTAFLRPFFEDLTIEEHKFNFLRKRRNEKYAELMHLGKEKLVKELMPSWKKEFIAKVTMDDLAIKSGLIDFIPDSSTTRLYTTVSMMVSDQRSYLRYQGNPLNEADFSCALPFLSQAIFLPQPYKDLGIEELIAEHTKLMDSDKYDEYIDLIQRIHRDGVGQYQKLVCTGKLYDHLSEVTGKSRSVAKTEVFRAFFDKPDKETPMKKELEKLFPDVIRVFDLLKTGFVKTRREGRTKDEIGNGLCMMLYRLESNLIIDRVCRAYHERHPEAPLFTVHDAILTDREHIYELRDLMMDEAERMIGFRPGVKIGH